MSNVNTSAEPRFGYDGKRQLGSARPGTCAWSAEGFADAIIEEVQGLENSSLVNIRHKVRRPLDTQGLYDEDVICRFYKDRGQTPCPDVINSRQNAAATGGVLTNRPLLIQRNKRFGPVAIGVWDYADRDESESDAGVGNVARRIVSSNAVPQ